MFANYWREHSTQCTVEAMMLDSAASVIDAHERPEVTGWTATALLRERPRCCGIG